MKKAGRIKFDTIAISDITDELIEVNKDFYIKNTNILSNGVTRFPIPKEIVAELELRAGIPCYFVKYSEGVYLSFGKQPDTDPKLMRMRKLASAGMYNTLYLRIPQFIQQNYQRITSVKLVRTPGFENHEWQIQFLSTDSTYLKNYENF